MTMLINHVLFWSAVILCVISAYKVYLSTKLSGFEAREWEIPENTYRILFALAVFAAVFIRIYKFGEVPGGFNQDGAMAAVDAKAIAEYGTDRFGMRFPVHLTAWGIGQMSALLTYLMVPFVKAFGLVPWAVRLPSLLVSLAGLACLYGFARDVFGKTVGLIVFCFAAINPWHILQSRWAIDCNLYAHFFLFGVFFLNRAVGERRRRGYLFLSMVMFGLCMYCYGLSIYTMSVFLFAACIYLLVTKKVSVADVLLAAAVYLSVAWPFIAVMAINFFRWETIETPLFTIPYFPDSVRFNDILFFAPNKLSQVVENVKSLLAVTVFQKKDFPWNDVRNFGIMYLFSMPFAVLGLGGVIYEFRKRAGAVLLLLFLGTGIWCGLATKGANVNRVNIIYYPIIILVGIGIYDVVRMISLPRLRYAIAAAYAVIFLLFAREYFTGYAVDVSVQFEKGLGEALTSLKESDAEKIYITTKNKKVSEILTLFWCDIDALYFQGKVTPEGRLPYAERYCYHEMGEMEVDDKEDAAYLIAPGELELFDDSLYTWELFGGYYVVRKRER